MKFAKSNFSPDVHKMKMPFDLIKRKEPLDNSICGHKTYELIARDISIHAA